MAKSPRTYSFAPSRAKRRPLRTREVDVLPCFVKPIFSPSQRLCAAFDARTTAALDVAHSATVKPREPSAA